MMMVSPQVLNSSVMYVCFTVGDKATNLCTLSSSGWIALTGIGGQRESQRETGRERE